jgi:hypothetical protein
LYLFLSPPTPKLISIKTKNLPLRGGKKRVVFFSRDVSMNLTKVRFYAASRGSAIAELELGPVSLRETYFLSLLPSAEERK